MIPRGCKAWVVNYFVLRTELIEAYLQSRVLLNLLFKKYGNIKEVSENYFDRKF